MATAAPQIKAMIQLASAGIRLDRLLKQMRITTRVFQLLLEAANRKSEQVVLVDGMVWSGGACLKAKQNFELDDQVKKIRRLQTGVGAAMWHLGMAIGELYENGLWKIRADTWEVFCKDELKMSSVHALRLADVADLYGEPEVAAYGVTKLGLLASAPPEAQDDLKALVASGATVSKVTAAVQAAKAKAKHVRAARDGSKRHPTKRRVSHKISCPHCGASWMPRQVDREAVGATVTEPDDQPPRP